MTFRSGGAGDAPAPSDDATNHDKRTEPSAAGFPGALKRSRSLGAELLPVRPEPMAAGAAAALGHFSPEVQSLLVQAVQDPGRLSGRQTMDLVRHVFNRLVEAARYGEPAARLCLAVIERERTETFLETLLNTCQVGRWQGTGTLGTGSLGFGAVVFLCCLVSGRWEWLWRWGIRCALKYDTSVCTELNYFTKL